MDPEIEGIKSLGRREFTHMSDNIATKQDWARRLRLLHSPLEQLTPSGAIDQKFFRPTADEIGIETDVMWSEEQQKKLIADLQERGLFIDVKEYGYDVRNTPDWESLLPRIQLILGTDDISQYAEWRGNALKERKKNVDAYVHAHQGAENLKIAVPKV